MPKEEENKIMLWQSYTCDILFGARYDIRAFKLTIQCMDSLKKAASADALAIQGNKTGEIERYVHHVWY
jgi:hypothetical protein